MRSAVKGEALLNAYAPKDTQKNHLNIRR